MVRRTNLYYLVIARKNFQGRFTDVIVGLFFSDSLILIILILGPLLFLIYINDLINSTTKLSTILFADDTNMFCSGKDMHELETTVNSELAQVQEWLTLNQLTLNIKKTNFIIFKSHKKRLRS